MIAAIILQLGAALVVTGGFAAAPPTPSGDLFRVDQPSSGSSLFR
jgi:hypothetical protein